MSSTDRIVIDPDIWRNPRTGRLSDMKALIMQSIIALSYMLAIGSKYITAEELHTYTGMELKHIYSAINVGLLHSATGRQYEYPDEIKPSDKFRVEAPNSMFHIEDVS